MSFDIVNDILQAENDAKKTVAAAESKAAQLTADADKAGRKLLEDEALRAAEEAAKLTAQAIERGKAGAEAIRQETEKEIETIRSSALAKMEAAAEEVVKKVVNG